MNRFLLFLLLASCNQSTTQKSIQPSPKGELVFLLQYNNQLPSNVGFLTNHIVERRLANLLKNDFETFLSATEIEIPLQVDSASNCVHALFLTDTVSKNVSAEVIIDVSRDAFWVEYQSTDGVKSWADYPSLPKPVL